MISNSKLEIITATLFRLSVVTSFNNIGWKLNPTINCPLFVRRFVILLSISLNSFRLPSGCNKNALSATCIAFLCVNDSNLFKEIGSLNLKSIPLETNL